MCLGNGAGLWISTVNAETINCGNATRANNIEDIFFNC